MATLLVTRRMDPALAARVEASVRGRRGRSAKTMGPRVVAVVRLVVAAIVVGAIATIATGRLRGKNELAASKRALLDSARAQSASLTADDRGALARTESWLARFEGAYEGDLVADELRGAFDATVRRPAVYVRGPVGAFAGSTAVARASAASYKDPFVLCTLEPPSSRDEKQLLAKVRAAYGKGGEARTSNVRRLFDVVVAMPVLSPSWSDRVDAAADAATVGALTRELERASLETATRAMKAELLWVLLDEPGDGRGPTELDGERAHGVRIGLVDLAAAKVLLRLRKPVDPTWISPATRAEYASGIDGCALALDARSAVTGR